MVSPEYGVVDSCQYGVDAVEDDPAPGEPRDGGEGASPLLLLGHGSACHASGDCGRDEYLPRGVDVSGHDLFSVL